MEYKHFVVSAFERLPNKWRARVSRTDGKALIANRHRSKNFVIDSDATTGAAALLLAMAAIDKGFISTADKTPIEKFWRRTPSVELDNRNQNT